MEAPHPKTNSPQGNTPIGQDASGKSLGNLGSGGGGFKEGGIVQWLRGKLDWGKLPLLSCLPFLIGKMENISPA